MTSTKAAAATESWWADSSNVPEWEGDNDDTRSEISAQGSEASGRSGRSGRSGKGGAKMTRREMLEQYRKGKENAKKGSAGNGKKKRKEDWDPSVKSASDGTLTDCSSSLAESPNAKAESSAPVAKKTRGGAAKKAKAQQQQQQQQKKKPAKKEKKEQQQPRKRSTRASTAAVAEASAAPVAAGKNKRKSLDPSELARTQTAAQAALDVANKLKDQTGKRRRRSSLAGLKSSAHLVEMGAPPSPGGRQTRRQAKAFAEGISAAAASHGDESNDEPSSSGGDGDDDMSSSSSSEFISSSSSSSAAVVAAVNSEANAELAAKLAAVLQEQQRLQAEVEALKPRLEATEGELAATRSEAAQAEAELQSSKEAEARLAATVEEKSSAIASLEGAVEGLKESVAAVTSEKEAEAQAAAAAIAAREEAAEQLRASLEKEQAALAATTSELETVTAEREDALGLYHVALDHKRSLNSKVMDLQGAIRVYVRVRPTLPREMGGKRGASGSGGNGSGGGGGGGNHGCVFDIPASSSKLGAEGSTEIALLQGGRDYAGNATSQRAKTHSFSFDRIFRPQDDQATVYAELEPFFDSFAVGGRNVCIFAYGQTGSGKTHTIQGPEDEDLSAIDPADQGIIPRAFASLFKALALAKERKGQEATVTISVLEVYNETLRDLAPVTTEGGSAGSSSSMSKKQAGSAAASLTIHHDASGSTSVQGLQQHVVSSPEEAMTVFAQAKASRTEAATNMNSRSSRSHLVLGIDLQTSIAADVAGCGGVTQQGSARAYIVDLAGSERLNSSGSASDATLLKQTQNINKSLTCLGDVIAALAKKASHIPYRNSKLTYLLQNALGGAWPVAFNAAGEG